MGADSLCRWQIPSAQAFASPVTSLTAWVPHAHERSHPGFHQETLDHRRTATGSTAARRSETTSHPISSWKHSRDLQFGLRTLGLQALAVPVGCSGEIRSPGGRRNTEHSGQLRTLWRLGHLETWLGNLCRWVGDFVGAHGVCDAIDKLRFREGLRCPVGQSQRVPVMARLRVTSTGKLPESKEQEGQTMLG